MDLMCKLRLLALNESNDGPESAVRKIFSTASDVHNLLSVAGTRRVSRT